MIIKKFVNGFMIVFHFFFYLSYPSAWIYYYRALSPDLKLMSSSQIIFHKYQFSSEGRVHSFRDFYEIVGLNRILLYDFGLKDVLTPFKWLMGLRLSLDAQKLRVMPILIEQYLKQIGLESRVTNLSKAPLSISEAVSIVLEHVLNDFDFELTEKSPEEIIIESYRRYLNRIPTPSEFYSNYILLFSRRKNDIVKFYEKLVLIFFTKICSLNSFQDGSETVSINSLLSKNLAPGLFIQFRSKMIVKDRNLFPNFPESASPGSLHKVSIITSVYSGEKYLKRFLENIVNLNGFKDRHELIIINANSPQNEEKLIKPYQERYPNIVYERLNNRVNIYEAWNIGIKMCRNGLITNANVDDLKHPKSVDTLAEELFDSKSDVAYPDYIYFCDLPKNKLMKLGQSNFPYLNEKNLLFFNSPHAAPLWRKDIHARIGYFDESYQSAGDWEFWLRALSNDLKFHRVHSPLVAYNLNVNGLSTRTNSPGLIEQWSIREKYLGNLNSSCIKQPILYSNNASPSGMYLNQKFWDSIQ